MTTTVKTAGLIDAKGERVNTILVHVDDDSGKVVDYAPAPGMTLVIEGDAPVDIIDPDKPLPFGFTTIAKE